MNCYEYEIHEHVYLIAGKLKRDNVFLVGGSELVLNPLEKIYCITFGKGVLLFFSSEDELEVHFYSFHFFIVLLAFTYSPFEDSIVLCPPCTLFSCNPLHCSIWKAGRLPVITCEYNVKFEFCL